MELDVLDKIAYEGYPLERQAQIDALCKSHDDAEIELKTLKRNNRSLGRDERRRRRELRRNHRQLRKNRRKEIRTVQKTMKTSRAEAFVLIRLSPEP